LIALYLALLLIDQITKWWALHYFTTAGPALAQNTGIAFGLFQEHLGIIIAVNIIFLVGVWLLRAHFFSKSKLQTLALWFILAGGTGNCFDRITKGYVVDFIHWGPIPTFNVADIWVNIGIALLLLHLFLDDRNKRT
jgi:signal peptidase II